MAISTPLNLRVNLHRRLLTDKQTFPRQEYGALTRAARNPHQHCLLQQRPPPIPRLPRRLSIKSRWGPAYFLESERNKFTSARQNIRAGLAACCAVYEA